MFLSPAHKLEGYTTEFQDTLDGLPGELTILYAIHILQSNSAEPAFSAN
jgi:hypothetical protein